MFVYFKRFLAECTKWLIFTLEITVIREDIVENEVTVWFVAKISFQISCYLLAGFSDGS